jgi:hypothetical protein
VDLPLLYVDPTSWTPELNDRKLTWPSSCITASDLANPDNKTLWVAKAPLQAQLTDTSQAAAISKRLFFAGIFLGLLGALIVEIIGSAFDVAEHWSARRRTRRDEDQQPEPDDEPYNPGPRGYL